MPEYIYGTSAEQLECFSDIYQNTENVVSDTRGILERLQREIADGETTSIAGIAFKFTDDLWNFKEGLKANKHASYYFYDFRSLNVEDKVCLKLMVISFIGEKGLHSPYTKTTFNILKSLAESLYSDGKNLCSFRKEDIEKFFNENRASEITNHKTKRMIYAFYRFLLSLNAVEENEELISYLEEKIDRAYINSHIETAKTPLLPSWFYSNLEKMLYDAVFNEELSKDLRGIYGLAYIDTQTGLRISELSILLEDCLQIEKRGGITANLLRYRSSKSGKTRGEDIYVYRVIPINKRCVDVINLLKELFKEERTELKGEKYLAVNKTAPNGAFSDEKIRKGTIRFCVRNALKLGLVNVENPKDFDGPVITKESAGRNAVPGAFKESGVGENACISTPSFHQYRVYVENDWHKRGVSKRAISIAHVHCELMDDYYLRPFDNKLGPSPEGDEFKKEVLPGVYFGDINLIGIKSEETKKIITSEIDDAISKIMVLPTLDSVIDVATKNSFVLNRKACGFCFRPDMRDCHIDGEDEYKCIFGSCVNKHYIYTDLPNLITEADKHIEAMFYNDDNGYVNAAQREAHCYIGLFDLYLEELFVEFERILEEKGSEWILTRHPELQHMIDTFDEKYKQHIAYKNDALELLES